MSKKNRQRGKSLQAWLARDLGGQNIGTAGGSDVRYRSFDIECKEREKIPKFIEDTMEQAEANCEGSQIPVSILHKLTTKHEFDIIFMRYRYWKQLINRRKK